jgi:hypothetical protein
MKRRAWADELDAWCIHLAARGLETGDLHAAAELAGHRDVNVTRAYAGRAKLVRVRRGIDQIDLSTSTSPQNAGSEPSSGRTWVRTRDLREVSVHDAPGPLDPQEG